MIAAAEPAGWRTRTPQENSQYVAGVRATRREPPDLIDHCIRPAHGPNRDSAAPAHAVCARDNETRPRKEGASVPHRARSSSAGSSALGAGPTGERARAGPQA
eukprot:CAMPEP_0206000804 /NCGR_PEP_ID=MMETSP1464-20131121/1708_1 /ASSEMBLY_ACC=CAM_ASM_001124 /TAXON_ID=119497 /ORGANISM="Exanthemachrysis gayraliae, Strain RCC1523" /LENGTH=102 /DNA_ID=CAMNT_0053374073 /DNA_START=97 /DNA_END=405 /DNA_ORIENTATION=+